MGYQTDFEGRFNVSPPLTAEHVEKLLDFAADRHERVDGAPSYYCQWVPTIDGTGIEWDGGEKFYEYDKWIEYLIIHFLRPWGYTLNGEVAWNGENPHDLGKIVITNNVVQVKHGRVIYE